MATNWWYPALCALAFALHVSAGAAASLASPANLAEPAPVLSFFQADGQGFHWRFWRADSNRVQSFLTAAAAPHHVFWSRSELCAYYVLGNTIYRSRIDVIPAQPERFADLPAAFGEVQVLWRCKLSKNYRVPMTPSFHAMPISCFSEV